MLSLVGGKVSRGIFHSACFDFISSTMIKSSLFVSSSLLLFALSIPKLKVCLEFTLSLWNTYLILSIRAADSLGLPLYFNVKSWKACLFFVFEVGWIWFWLDQYSPPPPFFFIPREKSQRIPCWLEKEKQEAGRLLRNLKRKGLSRSNSRNHEQCSVADSPSRPQQQLQRGCPSSPCTRGRRRDTMPPACQLVCPKKSNLQGYVSFFHTKEESGWSWGARRQCISRLSSCTMDQILTFFTGRSRWCLSLPDLPGKGEMCGYFRLLVCLQWLQADGP